MSDRHLSEAEWRKFSRGHDYKDTALLKALAAFEKAERAPAQAQLGACEALAAQAEVLRKIHKGDAALATYLRELEKSLEDVQTKAQLQARKQAEAAEAAQKAEEDEEDSSPTSLGTGLVPLMRQVRGGLVFPALVAMAGPQTVVLVSRKAIGSSLRKLVAAELGVKGGVKYIPAQCLFEDGMHTFVVEHQAAGLAKRLKAALFRQTEQRYKLRVRGQADDDVDVDEQTEADEAEGRAGDEAKDPLPRTPPGAAAGPSNATEDQASVIKRQAALAQAVARLGRHAEAHAAKFASLQAFVSNKAAQGQYPAARQALDALEGLLKSVAQAAATAASSTIAPAIAPAIAPTIAPTTAPTSASAHSSTASPAIARPPPDAAEAAAFKKRLAALLPRVLAAAATGGPAGAAVKLTAAQAGQQALRELFGPAQALLDDAERMLAELEAATAAAQAQARLTAFQARWSPAREAWQVAMTQASAEITRLQTAFRASGDLLGKEIATVGLPAMAARLQGDVQAAVEAMDKAVGDAPARTRLMAAGAALARTLESDPVLPLLEDNPYGVLVALRSRIGAALALIDQACAA